MLLSSSKSFRVSGLILRPSLIRSSFLCRMKDKELVPFICIWLSSFLKPFVEDVLSFNMYFFIFIRNQVMGGGWVCIWVFYSVPFLQSSSLSISCVCLSHSQSYVNPIQSRQFASDILSSFSVCRVMCRIDAVSSPLWTLWKKSISDFSSTRECSHFFISPKPLL